MSSPGNIEAAMLAYRRKRESQAMRSGFVGVLVDVFMFRRMVTPWLIRCFFAVCFVGAAVAATYGAWIIVAGSGATSANFAPGAAPVTMGGLQVPATLFAVQWMRLLLVISPLLWLVAIRLLCEFSIVVFQINESLTDARKAITTQAMGQT